MQEESTPIPPLYTASPQPGGGALGRAARGCELRPAQSAHLKRHTKTHRGGEALVCAFSGCEYKPPRPGHPQTHTKTHTAAAALVCPWRACHSAPTQPGPPLPPTRHTLVGAPSRAASNSLLSHCAPDTPPDPAPQH